MENQNQPIIVQPVQHNHSMSVGKLALALAKAQGEIKNAIKDSTNPHFNRSYADLASVWEACRKPLSDNNLAVVQTFEGGKDGDLTVHTMLIHGESGEWIRGSMSLKAVRNDPQGVGACSTYGRRFSLAAIVGVAPDDDDDGNTASGRQAKVEGKKSEEKKVGAKESSVKPADKGKPPAGAPPAAEKKEAPPVESFDKGVKETLAHLRAAIEIGIMTAVEGDEHAAIAALKELTAYKLPDGATKSLTFEELRKVEKLDYLKKLLVKVKGQKGAKILPDDCPLKWPDGKCPNAVYIPNDQGDMVAQCDTDGMKILCPYALGVIFS